MVDDFDILTIRRGEEQQEDKKYLLLDINFFDKFNNLIAEYLKIVGLPKE